MMSDSNFHSQVILCTSFELLQAAVIVFVTIFVVVVDTFVYVVPVGAAANVVCF